MGDGTGLFDLRWSDVDPVEDDAAARGDDDAEATGDDHAASAEDGDGTGGSDAQDGPPAVVRMPGAHAGSVTGAVLARVTDALEAHDIEHFFIARGRSGSRVAVPAAELADAQALLRELGEAAPVYVRVERGKRTWVGLARDLPDAPLGPRVREVVVYAEVVDPVSGLRLGRQQGCTLEPWVEDDRGGLTSTVYNPRTQEVTAEDRRQPALAGVGEQYVTVIPPFDLPDAFDVSLPVDAVILWVDGADPRWRKARERRREELGLPADDPGTEERLYADHGELRYLLRSLERYAPWLRQLYLVTAGQRPGWLRTDHPWLTLVDHTDIVEPTALPTFSPRPVTARMHRIEGLSEHFLYFNDDMMLARAVEPRHFFTSNGMARFFLSNTTVPRHPSDEPHLGSRQVIQGLIRERYGVSVSRTFKHAPYAMTKRTLQLMERHFGDEIDATVHRPFRTTRDIIPEWMHHYVAYLEGSALPGKISYGYFPIGLRRGLDGLSALLTTRNRDCFCVNDLGDEVGVEEAERCLADVLPRMFPGASELELDEAVPAASSPGPAQDRPQQST